MLPDAGDPHSGGQSQATAEAEGGVLAMSRGDNDTLMSAASAGVATPPAAKLTTGSRPSLFTSRSTIACTNWSRPPNIR